MKSSFLLLFLIKLLAGHLYGQDQTDKGQNNQLIYSLIDTYSLAREKSDTALLRSILTADVDQLVSSGEWRNGIRGSVAGMLRSSGSNPGERTLIVDKLRFLSATAAIVDARYEIKNVDGSARKMWSTFVVVYEEGKWKITAIRNMLPAGRP